MPVKKRVSKRGWVDPDDAPQWTKEQFDRAEVAVGGKVVRPAQGTLTVGRQNRGMRRSLRVRHTRIGGPGRIVLSDRYPVRHQQRVGSARLHVREDFKRQKLYPLLCLAGAHSVSR